MNSGDLSCQTSVARQAAKLIESIPLVSKAQFQSRTQVYDILLTLPPDYDLRNFFNRYWIKISSLAQGCPYCSAKLYLGDNLVAGYGFRSNGDKAALRTRQYDQFLNRVKGAILLRVPGLTAAQQDSILKFIRTRIGVGFDVRWVIESFCKRQFARFFPASAAAPKVTMVSVSGPGGPLSCSTMISLPFAAAGIDLAAIPRLAWPIDFLLSPRTVKICRF